jgi:hypothetical protein
MVNVLVFPLYEELFALPTTYKIVFSSLRNLQDCVTYNQINVDS